MRRALTLVAVVLALVGPACSKHSPQAHSRYDGGKPGAVDKQPEDVEDKKLHEPETKRAIDKLRDQAAQVFGLCEVWRELDNIDPPDPENRAAGIAHAERMYTTFKLFDPTRTVFERVESSGGRPAYVRKIAPPPQVVADIALLRAAWYAQWIRLTVYDTWYRAGTIDRAGLTRRTDRAFVLLTQDPVTSAQLRLRDFEASHCHL